MKFKIGDVVKYNGGTWFICGHTKIKMNRLEIPGWFIYEMREPEQKLRISKMLLDSCGERA